MIRGPLKNIGRCYPSLMSITQPKDAPKQTSKIVDSTWLLHASKSFSFCNIFPSNRLFVHRRMMVTSAQKRKLKRKGYIKEHGIKKPDELLMASVEANSKQAKARQREGFDWTPVIFLGIFPVLMSGLVLLVREDLRQQVSGLVAIWRGTSPRQNQNQQEQLGLNGELSYQHHNSLQTNNETPAGSKEI